MIDNSRLARSLWSHSLFLAVGLTVWPGASHAAEVAANTGATYTWHAELVAFDEAAGTITVKSRLVSNADADALSDLSKGDRATLTWSGISWATDIRSIARGIDSEHDRMTLPVEFVASENSDSGRYITFEVPIPSESAPKIAMLEPGDWVTATSPLYPSGADATVAAIRAFTDVS